MLATHGTLYVHLDYREVHYVKVLLDANAMGALLFPPAGAAAGTGWPATATRPPSDPLSPLAPR